MKKIFEIILKLFKSEVIIPKLIDLLNNIVLYLKDIRKDRTERQRRKEDDEFDEKIEETVNNGSLDDLLNLKR